MKKMMIALSCVLMTSVSFAGTRTVALTELEVATAVAVFNRVNPPLTAKGPCTTQAASIESVTKGFNPASWTIAYEDVQISMNMEEVSFAIALFNRAQVPLSVSGITLTMKAVLKADSCGFEPNAWTLEYETVESD